MNESQKVSLAMILSRDGQGFVDPNMPLNLRASDRTQVIDAFIKENGSVIVEGDHGDGVDVEYVQLDSAGHRTPYTAPLPPNPNATMNAQFHLILADLRKLMLHDAMSALLAGLLLVGGICLARSPRVGVVLHWAYATIKLPLCVAFGTTLLPKIIFTRAGLLAFLPTSLALVLCVYAAVLVIVLLSRKLRVG